MTLIYTLGGLDLHDPGLSTLVFLGWSLLLSPLFFLGSLLYVVVRAVRSPRRSLRPIAVILIGLNSLLLILFIAGVSLSLIEGDTFWIEEFGGPFVCWLLSIGMLIWLLSDRFSFRFSAEKAIVHGAFPVVPKPAPE